MYCCLCGSYTSQLGNVPSLSPMRRKHLALVVSRRDRWIEQERSAALRGPASRASTFPAGPPDALLPRLLGLGSLWLVSRPLLLSLATGTRRGGPATCALPEGRGRGDPAQGPLHRPAPGTGSQQTQDAPPKAAGHRLRAGGWAGAAPWAGGVRRTPREVPSLVRGVGPALGSTVTLPWVGRITWQRSESHKEMKLAESSCSSSHTIRMMRRI